jgi:hypothetical protein
VPANQGPGAMLPGLGAGFQAFAGAEIYGYRACEGD